MTHVLVTGGAGYIGSHCCKELHRRGFIPVTLDNLVYGHREHVKWGEFVEGDIADATVYDAIFQQFDIRAVMHFAAFAYVGESVVHPAKYYRNNVLGTIVLLDQVVARRIPHFIFSSTCSTYGVPRQVPIDETHPQEPINPYGKSKLMIEQILADYSAVYPLTYMNLRYFNAAGADPQGEIGESHDPETHLIPLILAAARKGAEPLKVFGDDYDTEDGSCIRDYIHVADLADAHIRALEMLMDGHRSECINLGTGRGYSVLQTIAAARRVTGRGIPFEVTARRPGDPAVLVASNAKARRLLGWQPRFADLEQILTTAWNWHSR
jgi:UDP-glucose-4-epimerase GalE